MSDAEGAPLLGGSRQWHQWVYTQQARWASSSWHQRHRKLRRAACTVRGTSTKYKVGYTRCSGSSGQDGRRINSAACSACESATEVRMVVPRWAPPRPVPMLPICRSTVQRADSCSCLSTIADWSSPAAMKADSSFRVSLVRLIFRPTVRNWPSSWDVSLVANGMRACVDRVATHPAQQSLRVDAQLGGDGLDRRRLRRILVASRRDHPTPPARAARQGTPLNLGSILQ